jgi:hypothetical protein
MTTTEAIQQGMQEFLANLDAVRGDIDQQLADVDLGAAGVEFTDSSNARVIGVYGGYAPGVTWFGGEVQVLYAYDQITGEAGAYLYTGGTIGPSVGASAIGGVFLFDGPIDKIIGPTVGVQGASGVAVGISATLDLNPYFMVQIGAELGVSAEVTVGWTFDANGEEPRVDWAATEATLRRLYGDSPDLLRPILAELATAKTIPSFGNDFIEKYGMLIIREGSGDASREMREKHEALLDDWREATRNRFDNPPASPLVLDLDGDGIELVSLDASAAYFDLDVNGFAERTGWVAASCRWT